MKIDVITMWHNEALIAPFFLKHYEFADTIYVFLDTDTNDETKEVCSRFANVKVEMVTFPDGLDDQRKVDMISALYRTLDSDWVIAPDSDEFIFAEPLGATLPEYLGRNRVADVIYVHMWEVFRHQSDSALDPQLPAVPQRRHGDPTSSGDEKKRYLWFRRAQEHRKPIVVRGRKNIVWTPGLHGFVSSTNQLKNRAGQLLGFPRVSNDVLFAAHWAMADPEIVIRRRLLRRERQSSFNREKGYGTHVWEVTEEGLLNTCTEHLNDPQLF